MKKLFSAILLSCALLVGIEGKAQTPVPTPGIVSVPTLYKFLGTVAGADTTVDAESDTLVTKLLSISAYAHNIQATAVRVSGTNTIKCVLYSSSDGYNFAPHFASIDASKASLDTFTITNTTGPQTHVFPIDPTTHRKRFMMIFDGTGTGKFTIMGSDYFLQ